MDANRINRMGVKDLQARAEEKLMTIEPLRTLGNALEIKVGSGSEIVVSGPVHSGLLKRMVLQSLHEIPGVMKVVDRIVPDPDLDLNVAKTLTMDERTRDIPPGQVSVRSHLGVTIVLGKLPHNIPSQDVVNVISAVQGVRSVVDKLQE